MKLFGKRSFEVLIDTQFQLSEITTGPRKLSISLTPRFSEVCARATIKTVLTVFQWQ